MKKNSNASSATPFGFSAAIATLMCLQLTCFAAVKPAELRCEYRVNPLGMDEAQPRLTWQVESGQRGAKQTAYQILVASSAELLKQNSGDLWDSGRVASAQTVNIVYAGKPLPSLSLIHI